MHQLKRNVEDFWTLLTINILDIRTTWMFQMIFGILTPFGIIFFLRFYIDMNDSSELIRLVSGNIVISMTMPILLLLTSRLSILKRDGSIDYYRTLPISMNIFTFSLVTSYLLTYIPSIIVIFLLGSLLLGIKVLSISSLVVTLGIQILSVLTMVGIAALIGLKSNSPEIANAVGNITFTLCVSISPVLVPADKMPEILKGFSYLMPTTYSVNLIYMSLQSNYNNNFFIYLSILIILSILSIVLLKKVVK